MMEQRVVPEPAERDGDAAGQPASVSAHNAAAMLGVHERTIRRAIARGELAATKHGGSYSIAVSDLERYAERPGRLEAAEPRARVVALPRADPVVGLPQPVSSFIGRRDDVAALCALLVDPEVRLLTLTGPGGIGKTRLALAAADAVREAFPDGTFFVALATIDRAELVLPEIGHAFGLHDTRDGGLRGRLRAYLQAKRLLLLLDNFEQVLAAAPLVAEIAAEAPGVTVLVTSRAPLRLSGERELAVPPLALPDRSKAVTEETLLASDAGRLFVERTRGPEPSFAVTDATAPAIGEICARLDGLPLAIELAAAQAKHFPPHLLLEQLATSLPVLTAGPHDAPQRQRTLRNAIAWSYDLLTPEEQTLFRRLAIFVGGFTLEAATWVSDESRGVEKSSSRGDPEDSPESRRRNSHQLSPITHHPSPITLEVIGSLHEQSLLKRDLGPDGELRFAMLETVREFGLEQLAACGEAAAVARAHAAYFLRFARGLQPLVLVRATRAPLDRLSADHANLLAALIWLEAAGTAVEFVGLAASLPGFWQAYSRHQEGREWLRRALEAADTARPVDRARVQIGLACMLTLQGAHGEADALFASGLPLLRAAAAPIDLVEALVWAGANENFAVNLQRAEIFLDEAVSLAEQVDDPVARAAVAANALANRGVTARGRGDLHQAAAYHQAALDHCQRHDLDLALTRAHNDMGDVERARGDARAAFAHYAAVLERADDVRDRRVVAEALIGMGWVAATWDQPRAAALLFAAAEALREQSGTGILFPEDDAVAGETVQTLRQVLGEPAFAAAWAEGRALTRADAVGIVATVGETARQATASASPGDRTALSAREREVLRLLVARRTDREIADELFISPRTVQWYVTRILGKLGVESRHQAATRAVAAGLVDTPASH
jgi:excisionase family DNA binding protein